MTRDFTSLPYSEYTTYAYDDNRSPIDRVVIHSTVCTLQQAINTFSSPNATTSAHYIIGNDGKLYAGLEEYENAYHSGNYLMNERSIGIEHEWYSGIHPSDALYKKSAALVKDICTFYGLPINSTTVIPHKSVVPTGCPNEIDVNRIISEANGAPSPVDECPAKLLSITAERDRLNGVITHKDELLKSLQDSIGAKNSQISGLENERKQLSDALGLCQNSSASYLEIAKKVPAMENLIKEQESALLSLREERTKLQKTITSIRASLIPKKYLSLKLYNFIMSLE